MNLAKQELRESLKAERLALGNEARQHKSRAIVAALNKYISDLNFNSIHSFEPIARLGEVDIAEFLEANKNKIFVHRKIADKWQTQPFNGEESVPDKFDAIIVPMLGFDETLHRIGFGGGYYDKFLSTQPQAHKIGVCFEQGKVSNLPTEPHDIPLDLIVTEENLYT